MSSIRLSPSHGLNPSVTCCFLCQKDIGLALFGALPGDKEAPRRIADSEPCDECKDLMKQGIILISVSRELTEDVKDPYRTGGWCVIREEAVRRMPIDEKTKESILKARMSFMEDEVWDGFGLPREKATG